MFVYLCSRLVLKKDINTNASRFISDNLRKYQDEVVFYKNNQDYDAKNSQNWLATRGCKGEEFYLKFKKTYKNNNWTSENLDQVLESLDDIFYENKSIWAPRVPLKQRTTSF